MRKIFQGILKDITFKSVSRPDGAEGDYLYPAVAASAVPGRRLRGRDANEVHVPEALRYRNLRYEQSRITNTRRWEAGLTRGGLTDGRLYLSSSKGYPLSVFSVIGYKGEDAEASKRKISKLVFGRTTMKLPGKGGGGGGGGGVAQASAQAAGPKKVRAATPRARAASPKARAASPARSSRDRRSPQRKKKTL